MGFTTQLLHSDRRFGVKHGNLLKPIHPGVTYGYEDAHDLARVPLLSLEDIASYPLITYDFAFTGSTTVSKVFHDAGVTPNVVLTAIDADVIKTYVNLGLGIGLIANKISPENEKSTEDRLKKAIPPHVQIDVIPESLYLENPTVKEVCEGLNGKVIFGDQFIDNPDKVSELREDHGADICEMEAFAILSVAREYEALDKCVVIKAVSDGADNEAKDAHMDNLEFAMNNSIIVLELVL